MKNNLKSSEEIQDELSQISVGFHEFTKRMRQQKALYLKYGIHEPDTMSRKVSLLSKEFNSSSKETPIESLKTSLNYLSAFCAAMRAEIPSSSTDVDNLAHKACDQFLELVSSYFPKDEVLESVNKALKFDSIKFSGSFIAIILQPVFDSFEMRTRNYCKTILDIFELNYKKLIKPFWTFSHIAANQDTKKLSTTLGGMIISCNKNRFFPYFINDKIRIIRNSIAHSHSIIDLESETIQFINKKPNGEEEALNPMNWDQLEEFGLCFYMECMGLRTLLKKHKRLLDSL